MMAMRGRRGPVIVGALAVVLLVAALAAYAGYSLRSRWRDDQTPRVAANRAGVFAQATHAPEAFAEGAVQRTLTGKGLVIEEHAPRDAFPAVFDPAFLPAKEASIQMADEDLVIGLSINGEHRAYPVPYLGLREVVNDVVGGVPVVITW